jgi:hypothetical protein
MRNKNSILFASTNNFPLPQKGKKLPDQYFFYVGFFAIFDIFDGLRPGTDVIIFCDFFDENFGENIGDFAQTMYC